MTREYDFTRPFWSAEFIPHVFAAIEMRNEFRAPFDDLRLLLCAACGFIMAL